MYVTVVTSTSYNGNGLVSVTSRAALDLALAWHRASRCAAGLLGRVLYACVLMAIDG